MSLFHSTHRYQRKGFSTSWILFNPDILELILFKLKKTPLKSWEDSPVIDKQFSSKNNRELIKDTQLVILFFLSV